MLLEFDNSLIEYFKENQLTSIEKDALDSIFKSHKKRRHYVYGTKRFFDFMSNYSDVPSNIREYCQAFYLSHYSLSRGVQNKKSKIKIMPSNTKFSREDFKRINREFGHSLEYTIFHIPLNLFEESYILERTILISEHSSDIEFYLQLSKGIKNLHKKNSGVIFSRGAGGGGTTFKVIEDKVKDKNIALIIVDSDKKHPFDDYGNTYKKAKETFDLYKNDWVLGFEVLDVHEKENLIPPTYYKIVNEGLEEKLNPWIELYNHPTLSHLYKFADLKSGISTSNFNDFFLPLLESKNKIVAESEANKWGYTDEFIGDKEAFKKLIKDVSLKIKNNKYILPPLGTKLLDDFSIENKYRKIQDELNEISKVAELPPSGKIKVERLKKNIDDILTLQEKLNAYHSSYLVELSDKINEWGFCNNKTLLA